MPQFFLSVTNNIKNISKCSLNKTQYSVINKLLICSLP